MTSSSPTGSTTQVSRPSLVSEPTRMRDLRRALAVVDTPTEADDGRDWGTIVWRVLVVFLILAAIATFALTRSAANTESDLSTLLRLIESKCAAGDPGGQLGVLCRQTEQVRNDNAAAVATESGLNTDQVIALVDAELDARGASAGPGPIDRGVVVDVVASVLAADPSLYRGEPGAAATQEQVDAAARAVIAADPDGFRGRDGDDGSNGVDGQSPPCLTEPGRCEGRGVTSTRVVDCRWQVTYTDGTTQDAGPACTSSGGPGAGPTSEPPRGDPPPSVAAEPPPDNPAPAPLTTAPTDSPPGLFG